MFEPYRSEDPSAGNSGINTLQPSSAYAVSTQSTEIETYEEYSELEFKHLNQNNPLPPTTIPPRKFKGYRDFMKAVFGRKSSR